MTYRLLFRSRSGLVTCGFLVLAALLFCGAVWHSDGLLQAIVNLPFPAAVLVWGWWTWVWPFLEMSDTGLVIRNQLRTYYVPWSAIDGAESRFGLYVQTGDKRILAAGVPARGGFTQSRETREDRPVLSFSKSIQQTVFVGPGLAAQMIEEEALYHHDPARRPEELSGIATRSLRQWKASGQSSASRFAEQFTDTVRITWNPLPIALQAAALVAVGLVLFL